MGLDVQELAQDNTVVIAIKGRFDFSLHPQFKDAYVNYTKDNMTFVLDLKDTAYMDSSALGMILLLKEHIEKLSGTLKITHPTDAVYKILEIAQFQRLLTIER
ncbi:STAS domain-containing protein [Thalassotalea sp. G2M2-11]|uniref:STAS domain-containing protein n=1 Tax=Thalassotalea sp. G2M2-11 TaxID=2787627 RepID=UPI0019D302E0|nr:STAS domain-containing protein [Thalassotalea sp. G2M2-11]